MFLPVLRRKRVLILGMLCMLLSKYREKHDAHELKLQRAKTMHLEVNESNFFEVYQLLVGIITPRPIAWVTTIDREGRVNLAPFSFFNIFSGAPPMVVFSPLLRRDGYKKDTLLNLDQVPEFVLNAATADLAAAVNASSKEYPYGENEATALGLELVPSSKVKPPRVKSSPTHLECRVRQIIPVGQGPMAGNLVLGEIIALHIDESVLDTSGKVDPHRLQTIARLGGDWFCRASDLFEMKRP
jgi:flavin reductase (DIM6/NTAB) family NADH-FMN oxidoreductase RutF